MAFLNDHFLKLKAGYLFPEIGRRVKVFGEANPDAAKRLMDWAASRKANELYAKWLPLVAAQGVSGSLENYPANIEQSMIKNDFAWASANRARIIAEWQRRYNGKSEPK